ncbi:hypothetical protein, partial [Klebsiella pneumoniae]|uniref:hypothetical protein n=1 Tax=Klebsiella pneumoniae TaxID=573 RepID=UPI0025A11CD4
MREVIFKNLTSVNSRKKDIFLQEVFEKDGVIARTERRCFYFIKEIVRLEKQEDIQKWMNVKNGSGVAARRQFYIFRGHNDKSGEDRLLC